jgi:hypothetical protein
MAGFAAGQSLSRLRLRNNIFRQGFEPLSASLHHRDGHMAGLASVNVPDDPGFAGVHAPRDLAGSAILKFAWRFSFHFNYSIAF